MGLFDSVYADCPTCEKPLEFQSKSGECGLNNYTVADAPTEVLWDVLNEPNFCRHCGEWSCLYDSQYPPQDERPKPAPKMVRVRQPSKPYIHKTQPSLRWWDEPFTSDDIVHEQESK